MSINWQNSGKPNHSLPEKGNFKINFLVKIFQIQKLFKENVETFQEKKKSVLPGTGTINSISVFPLKFALLNAHFLPPPTHLSEKQTINANILEK